MKNANAIAKLFYDTYCTSLGGKKPYTDEPLPSWEDFAAAPESKIQSDAFILAGQAVEKQGEEAKLGFIKQVDSLEIGDDTIIVMTVARTQPLTASYCAFLRGGLSELFPNGQRIYIKSEDMPWDMEVLADLLTPDDLAKLAARMESKALANGLPPLQNKEAVTEIIINARKTFFKGQEISYEQLVALANKTGQPSVTYGTRPKEGSDNQRGGILSPGRKTKVEDGMIFNVVHTNNA